MTAAGLSRRALFGAGLSRALGAGLGEPAPPPAPDHRQHVVADPREEDPRLADVAAQVVGWLGLTGRVLVLGGDDPLAEAALTAGCEVTSAAGTRHAAVLRGFDAVLGGFRTARDPAPRHVAATMRAAAAPGARLALLAWPGTPWARYETAYRHFSGLPEFDVDELTTALGPMAVVVARV